MSEPVIVQKAPIAAEVEEGKTYFWCACGRSGNQPFCDGSHKDTEFTPIQYAATKTEKVVFCCCKNSANAPLCDGTHATL